MPSTILHIARFETREVLGLGPAVGDQRCLEGGTLRNPAGQILGPALISHERAQEEARHDERAFVHNPLPEGFSPRKQVVQSRLDIGCSEGRLGRDEKPTEWGCNYE